jgi:hypothetical protein
MFPGFLDSTVHHSTAEQINEDDIVNLSKSILSSDFSFLINLIKEIVSLILVRTLTQIT